MDDDLMDIHDASDNSRGGQSDDGNEIPGERIENDDNPDAFDPDLGVGEVPPLAPPTQKRVRNLNNLNVDKLKGPRGVHTLEKQFTNVKFKGKGHEDQDLDMVMKKIEHWAHRLYPKYTFDDSLAAFERLGKKKELHTHMHKYRMNMLEPEEDKMHDSNDENVAALNDDLLAEPIDEFDAMLNEQIAISKNFSRSTHTLFNGNITGVEPIDDSFFGSQSSQSRRPETISEPQPPPTTTLTDEMRAKIALNKQKALERLQAKRSLTTTSENSESLL